MSTVVTTIVTKQIVLTKLQNWSYANSCYYYDHQTNCTNQTTEIEVVPTVVTTIITKKNCTNQTREIEIVPTNVTTIITRQIVLTKLQKLKLCQQLLLL